MVFMLEPLWEIGETGTLPPTIVYRFGCWCVLAQNDKTETG
jgi:hypothetical protein